MMLSSELDIKGVLNGALPARFVDPVLVARGGGELRWWVEVCDKIVEGEKSGLSFDWGFAVVREGVEPLEEGVRWCRVEVKWRRRGFALRRGGPGVAQVAEERKGCT